MSPSPSTRWCPTPEQLMILEELYRRGVRTPNASQIQKITAHLAFYGKIQGKNVFYWFQNHKARDRQKMRKKLAKQMHHHQLFQHHMLYNTPPPAAPAASNLYPQLPHHQDFTSPIYPFNLHYFHPGPSNFLQQFTATHSFSAHDQTLNPQAAGSFEAAPKNENWRMEIPTDWTKIGTLEADHVSLLHCNDRPLQTLELFPLKSEFSTTPQAV